MGETKVNDAYEEENEKAPDSISAKLNGESAKKSAPCYYFLALYVLPIESVVLCRYASTCRLMDSYGWFQINCVGILSA
jgi:hypothetical protein